jgi:sugar transport protein
MDGATANLLLGIALLLGTPFFVLFGMLSDRIGRKPIILAGCAVAALTYFPLFQALTDAGNPALARAQQASPVQLLSDPSECSFQFNLAGTTKFSSSCDVAKQQLANAAVNYRSVTASGIARVRVGSTEIPSVDAGHLDAADAVAREARFKSALGTALRDAGYPANADPASIHRVRVIAILFVLVLYVTMVYGPIAAMLVELFPTRIRYSAMSLPYHIGNGWFGGLLPTTAFAIVAQTGNIYSGLWYPVIVAGATALIGLLALRETRGRDLD